MITSFILINFYFLPLASFWFWFFLLSYVIIFCATESLSPRHKHALLHPIPKQNRKPSNPKSPHSSVLTIRLQLSTWSLHFLDSHLLFDSAQRGCGNITRSNLLLYDVQPCSIPLSPLTSEQSSRHIYTIKYEIPYAMLDISISPIFKQLALFRTGPGLFSPILFLDSLVSCYGIYFFFSFSHYYSCFHLPNLFI